MQNLGMRRADCIFTEKYRGITGPVHFKSMLFQGQLYFAEHYMKSVGFRNGKKCQISPEVIDNMVTFTGTKQGKDSETQIDCVTKL